MSAKDDLKTIRTFIEQGGFVTLEECMQALDRVDAEFATLNAHLASKITSEKLAWLVDNTHQLELAANDHRTNYWSVEKEFEAIPEAYREVEPEVKAECIKRDRLVRLQVYPSTPIGSYSWVHYDVNVAIAEAFDHISKLPAAALVNRAHR